jgi:hypothetical protein
MINFSTALALIKHIKIYSQDTSRVEPWIINSEQERILHALCTQQRNITLKARQIGSTSVHAYYVALAAFANPNTPIAVLNYSHTESKSILKKIKNFLLQLGCTLQTDNATELVLSNGSSITAITAVSAIDGESKAGRGRSYRIIYSSETAYYRDSHSVFASISAALTSDGQLIMESTATPADGVFRHTWESADYHHLFFGIEAHAAYQRDPMLLSDTDWNELQSALGFRSRAHASWWHHKMLADLAGDKSRALREYPVLSEHSWLSAGGRWVTVDPPILPFARSLLHPELKIYFDPVPGHYYVASIDTALGAGGDDSVLVVYDTNTNQIAASYCHNGSPIDVVVGLAEAMCKKYAVKTLYIEANGIGTATVLLAQAKNLPVVKITTTAANRAAGMLWAKQQIHAGLAADENLRDNCRSTCVESTLTGDRFSGRKDFLLALAFLGMTHPAWSTARDTPPPKTYAANEFNAGAFLKNARKKR